MEADANLEEKCKSLEDHPKDFSFYGVFAGKGQRFPRYLRP